MRSILTLLLLSCYSSILSAQTVSSITFNGRPEIISGDALGNIYIVKGAELFKFDEMGVLCCTFSDRTYGDITTIDVSNPLRLMLFYKSFAVVRWLDNQLAPQGQTDLYRLNLTDPAVVCASETQGMWVFDNSTSRLTKFDASLQPVGLSNDLRQDLMFSINPILMSESDYWLVMLNKNALLVFDKMGTYFKSIPLDSISNGLLLFDEWIYASGDKVIRLNIRTGKITETVLSASMAAGNIYLLPRQIARYHEGKVEIFSQ